MVVLVRLGVAKLVPVPSDEPPDEAEYQLIVPALAVAPKSTGPVPQRDPSVVPVMVVELIERSLGRSLDELFTIINESDDFS